MLLTASLRAVLTPMERIISAKSSRSSVLMMACTGVPSTFTPYLSRMPLRYSSMPQFRAVWPPKESMMESGLSFWITFSVNSAVTGRK